MQGTRVLSLTGRNKDGVKPRRLFRVSHDESRFQEILMELVKIAKPGERIYSSASARDVKKASYDFRIRMIESEREEDPLAFYTGMNSRWVSCLMSPTCQSPKIWMFDCDSLGEYDLVLDYLEHVGKSIEYQYETKNGYHVLVTPFHMKDPYVGITTLKQDNPLMLWMY